MCAASKANIPNLVDLKLRLRLLYARTPLTLPERRFEGEETAERAEPYAATSTLHRSGSRHGMRVCRDDTPHPQHRFNQIK